MLSILGKINKLTCHALYFLFSLLLGKELFNCDQNAAYHDRAGQREG